MYAYPGSLSRNLDRQRAALMLALRKHQYADVRRMYLDAGYDPRVASWALVMLAQFRGESGQALAFFDDDHAGIDDAEVLEPMARGLSRKAGGVRSIAGRCCCRKARRVWRPKNSAAPKIRTRLRRAGNNLGVALARLGHQHDACAAFDLAAKHGFLAMSMRG